MDQSTGYGRTQCERGSQGSGTEGGNLEDLGMGRDRGETCYLGAIMTPFVVLSISLGFLHAVLEFLAFPVGEPSNERRFIDSQQSHR